MTCYRASSDMIVGALGLTIAAKRYRCMPGAQDA